MKIKLMSDLHMEFGSKFTFSPMLDTILVLAGDIDNDHGALEYFIAQASKNFLAVIMVAGNHEFYGHEYHNTLTILGDIETRITNFYLLNNECVTFNDVTFIGATLWSSPGPGVFERINDHYQVRYDGYRLNSEHITEFNEQSKNFIKFWLKQGTGKKVVVTHFGPDAALTHFKWRDQRTMNTYFWSGGFQYHMHHADMWLYGHTHDSGDTIVDGCRCVCNPYGYYMEETNPDFNNNLILEV